MFQFLVETPQEQAGVVGGGSSGFLIPYLVAGLLVVLVLGFLLYKLFRLLRRPELLGTDRKKIEETWMQIEQTAEHGVMGAKLAVIEADKLLDSVLKAMMLPGETLGERLKSAAYKYPNIRQVWGAHRLRNQLVHDSAFELSVRQAKGALRDYQAALKTLNVM